MTHRGAVNPVSGTFLLLIFHALLRFVATFILPLPPILAQHGTSPDRSRDRPSRALKHIHKYHPFKKFAALWLAVLILPVFVPSPAHAREHTIGDLTIDHPSSRATPPGATVGVGYMKITNNGTEPDRLVGAGTPAASRVQLHQSVEKDGMTQMIEQEEGIEIPGGASIELSPGGYHMMLMGLERPLKKGETVPMTLRFERAGEIGVMLEVEGIGED